MSKKRKKSDRKASQKAVNSVGESRKSASFSRRGIILALGGVALAGGFLLLNSTPTTAKNVIMFKNPSCGCCSKWADHMRAAGFSVDELSVNTMGEIKEKHGVPWQMESCHTALVDGYVIEGHVPIKDVNRLLAERPAAKGLAVPGMPAGSPGMEGRYNDPYNVMLFQSDGSTTVFARY